MSKRKKLKVLTCKAENNCTWSERTFFTKENSLLPLSLLTHFSFSLSLSGFKQNEQQIERRKKTNLAFSLFYPLLSHFISFFPKVSQKKERRRREKEREKEEMGSHRVGLLLISFFLPFFLPTSCFREGTSSSVG